MSCTPPTRSFSRTPSIGSSRFMSRLRPASSSSKMTRWRRRVSPATKSMRRWLGFYRRPPEPSWTGSTSPVGGCGSCPRPLAGFAVIHDSIAGLEKLEELNLSSNLLEALPNSIGML
ncbi:unnamed protein product [Prunus armeniaca]|uniref:Uncharacterized protein n=1 Tax=Prunus armeniaca TaxID=36596 RepID=A0A6J5UHP4_PRUAR|nr:unnamed protein product [Prunus armeniaca]CAB4306443.1 unnamed protein product [Prunus armeniaca]